MKKCVYIFLVLAGVLFSSCEEESFPKQYSFRNDFETLDKVYLFEYNEENEIVGNNTLEEFEIGKERTFSVSSDNAVKVKVNIEVGTFSRWISTVYYLKDNEVVKIVLNGKTIVQKYEP